MKRIFFITVMLIGITSLCRAQISLEYLTQKKAAYKVGDKIELTIRLKTQPKTCQDGMDKVKIFVSGLDISNQNEWKKISTLVWQKNIQLTIIQSSKPQAKLTIMRKVDKEDLFCQEIFKTTL